MKKFRYFLLLTLAAVLINACSTTSDALIIAPVEERKDEEGTMKQSAIDKIYVKKEGLEVIYLAGGCFWGMEKLMQSIPGVVDVVSGYANGRDDLVPTYERVIGGNTGYRETVRVEYDPNLVSLDSLLFAYFHVIDPTIENAQGNDRETQYQTGVYTVDVLSKSIVEHVADIERERYDNFVVEIEDLERFYDAEEYHQDYLDKNPMGYCHISPTEIRTASEYIVDPADYRRHSEEKIREMLSELQYNVTQNGATERAFSNEYWDNHDRGIYVDVVTGEPLFSSGDKFDSGTGWPSFTQPIDENTVRLLKDNTFGMQRIEVRSRAGNSHLGHVFYNDSTSPSGTRYCINSAALRFIPYEKLTIEGYGNLLDYVSQ